MRPHSIVGQHRGLGNLTTKDKLFVTAIDPARGEVRVGPREAAERRELRIRDVRWLAPRVERLRATVQVRHRGTPIDAEIAVHGDGAMVSLAEPTVAAPGQAAVVYAGDRVLAEVPLERTLDLGFIESGSPLPSLQSEVCCEDELQIVCAPSHPLAREPFALPASLPQHDYISREAGSGTRLVVDRYLQQSGVSLESLNRVVELGSPEAIKGLVATGMGFAIMSKATVAKEVRLGELVRSFNAKHHQLTVDAAAQALQVHDEQLVEQIEAYAAEDYEAAYQVAFESYQHIFDTAAALADAIEAHVGPQLPVGGVATGGGGTARDHGGWAREGVTPR